ncbi:MAG: hypothetical protein LIR40_14205 [Bacteroidota bacterium]|nr:hypothetical protein [Bacteroidota bacterium]
MRLVIVDSNNEYDIGDVINPYSESCCHSFEFEKMSDITINKDRQRLWFGPISTGIEYWSLCSQRFLYIVDEETGKILFTANEYSHMDREDGSCQFYVELRDFFQELDKGGKTCILDDDEDFIV